jgi:D-glycero-D-manno-heptose 1,7-bisphosphate phosphatase
MTPAVFLDRDGVLNKVFVRAGTTHPPARPEEFEFLPGVVEACRTLHSAGFGLVVVSNQPDVARGIQTREGVEALNDLVRSALPVLDVHCCFHDGPEGCPCRKPRPGLLLNAAERWALDLPESFLVGDRWSDVLAGQSAGCRSVLIETPFSGSARCRPEYSCSSLLEAAEWILRQNRLQP